MARGARMDGMDRRLRRDLQADASLTAEALGARLGLSPSQAARRRQGLEAGGVIRGYGARLDPEALGLGVQAFVQVEMATHGAEAAAGFARLVGALPEVAGAWTLTGEADYLLRLWCRDLADLNRLLQERLLPHPAVARVRSRIVLEQLHPDSGLPVEPD